MLPRCYTCGSTTDVQRHHIDWNHSNNAAGNVIGLCQRCHAEVHSRCGYMSRQELETVRAAALARDPARFTAIPEAQPRSTGTGQLDLFED